MAQKHEEDQRLANMEAALLARLRGQEPRGVAAVFARLKLLDFAVLCSRLPYSPQRPVELAGQGTSDFPSVLENVLDARLLDHLVVLNPSSRKLTRRLPISSFRTTKIVAPSGFPQLQRTGEHAEFKRGTLLEGGEEITLMTVGAIVSLSRAAVRNDDIGLVDSIPRGAAQRIVANEDALFWSLVGSGVGGNGVTMMDGQQYFSTGHRNLMAAAALDTTSLGLAVAALRGQTALDGTLLNIAPRYLVVAPALEVAARKLLTDLGQSRIELLVEAGISDGSFYVWSDPAVYTGWVRGYLSSSPTPLFIARKGFAIDGTEFLLQTDIAFGPADFRAAVRTPAV